MKAWVLHGVGDIRFEEVEAPHPADGEVLVAVRAAGAARIFRAFIRQAHTCSR